MKKCNDSTGVIVINDIGEIESYNMNADKLLRITGTSRKKIYHLLRFEDTYFPYESFTINYKGKLITIKYEEMTINNNKKFIILINDITNMEEMKNNILILETIMKNVQDAVYAVDKEGNEIYYNNKIIRFYEKHRNTMIKELMTIFETKKPVLNKYNNYLSIDHKETHMLTSLLPVIKNDEVIAVVSINKYITRMKKLLAKAIDLQNQLNNYTKNEDLPANGTKYTFENVVGESKEMKSVINKAWKASLNNISVLLYGETGTGKEIFAQSIHNSGPSANEPFVAVNCAAIPETLLESLIFGTVKGAFTGAQDSPGLLEQAGSGTLFLDEINSMGTGLQAKLLRILEEKKVRRLGDNEERNVKCKIISATNADPWILIKKGSLRKDLFYRIAVVVLTIPPLRERKEDILVLCDYFIKKFNKIYGKKVADMSSEIKNIFISHSWPGNVRELSHILEGAFNMIENESILKIAHLPDYFQQRKIRENNDIIDTFHHNDDDSNLPHKLEQFERRYIVNALKKNKGNITKSAEMLGIKRQNLQSRMKKLNISRNDF